MHGPRGCALSFDLDIVTKDVDGNEIVHEVVSGHTYNLSPMWHLALPFLEGTRSLHARNCGALVPLLEEGLVDIAIREDAYRALNPENGWGDFEGFRGIYTRLTEMCRKYPSGWISWAG